LDEPVIVAGWGRIENSFCEDEGALGADAEEDRGSRLLRLAVAANVAGETA
jgi:hypothetical protein